MNKESDNSEKKPRKEKKHPNDIGREDVIEFLTENSSEGHMLSKNEIYAAMYRLAADSPEVIEFSDKTVLSVVERALDSLVDNQMVYGLMIKKKPLPENDDSKRTSNRKQYYAKGPLTDSQVRILRDAVIVYPYAEESETKNIVKALNKLTPEYNRDTFDYKKIKAMKFVSGEYYKNIEEIHKALSERKFETEIGTSNKENIRFEGDVDKTRLKKVTQIRFRYGEYDENKKLVAKKLKFPVKGETDPEIRRVNPVRLMWANGYYYLVGYSKTKKGEDVFINYRVDRMMDVECTSDTALLPDSSKFDLYNYKFSNPVMHSGTKHGVRMLCEKWLMNNIIDTFGFDVLVNETDDDRLLVDLKEVSLDGVMMWALEYWNGCEILEPPQLRMKMQEASKALTEKYNRAPTEYRKKKPDHSK